MLKPPYNAKDRTSRNYHKLNRKKPASTPEPQPEVYGPPAPTPVRTPYKSVMDDEYAMREGLKRLQQERDALINRPLADDDFKPSSLKFG